MKRRAGIIIALLLLGAAALLLSRSGGERSGPRPWKSPSAAELQRFREEPGIRIDRTALQQLKPGRVERVVDGDTVALIIDGRAEKVRLLNINTPETVDPRRPVEEYGREASAFLKSLLRPGTRVRLRPDVEERDRYGRLLLHLYLEDGTWVNALLVRAGYAQVMTVPPNVAAADFFRELQARAQRERTGLWQIPAYREP